MNTYNFKKEFDEWVHQKWPSDTYEAAGCRGAAKSAADWIGGNVVSKLIKENKSMKQNIIKIKKLKDQAQNTQDLFPVLQGIDRAVKDLK